MIDESKLRMGKVDGIWRIEIIVPKWVVRDVERDSGCPHEPPLTSSSYPTLKLTSQLNYGCSRRIGDEIPEDPFDGYAEFTFSLVPHTDEQPTP